MKKQTILISFIVIIILIISILSFFYCLGTLCMYESEEHIGFIHSPSREFEFNKDSGVYDLNIKKLIHQDNLVLTLVIHPRSNNQQYLFLTAYSDKYSSIEINSSKLYTQNQEEIITAPQTININTETKIKELLEGYSVLVKVNTHKLIDTTSQENNKLEVFYIDPESGEEKSVIFNIEQITYKNKFLPT